MTTQVYLAAPNAAAGTPPGVLGAPALMRPITYGDVISSMEEQLAEQLKARGKSLKRVDNCGTAIKGWMKEFGLSEECPVGVEFGAEFSKHMERYTTTLGAEGKKDQTISDRKSMVKAYREAWAFMVQSAAPGLPRGSFGQALAKLLEASDTPLAMIARRAGMHEIMLAAWRDEKSLPSRRFLPALHRLEGLFGIPVGTLASMLPTVLSGDSKRTKPKMTGHRAHQSVVLASPYYLKEFPPATEEEWGNLFLFYTDAAWLRTHGLQRNSRWRIREHDNLCPSAITIRNYIGAFFGYLTLPVNGEDPRRGGKGLTPEKLTLALLSDSDLVYSFLQFKKERTYLKRYNSGTHTFLCLCMSLLRPETGFLWQLPDFGSKLPDPVPEADWHKWCERHRSVIKSTLKDLTREGEIKKTRDPFEPIRSIIINNQHPLDVLFELADAYEADAPPRNATPRSRAVHYQTLFLIKFASLIPLRAFNLSVMTWRPDGTGNLYRKPDGSWWVRFEPAYLKNHKGAAKDTPFDVPLHPSLWPYVEEYLFVHRPNLTGADACDYVFRPGLPTRAKRKDDGKPLLTPSLSERILKVSQRYIPGCPGFCLHAFRHLVATEYIKNNPAGYAVAAAVLFDREETVRKNYAWVLPADKFGFWNDYVAGLLRKREEANARAEVAEL